MQEFTDEVLGRIIVRRHAAARHIRFRLSPRRELIASAPPSTPLFMIKAATRSSRKSIAKLLEAPDHQMQYTHDQQIGQSHRLYFKQSASLNKPTANRTKTTITVVYPDERDIDSPEVQSAAQTAVIAAFNREARAYLPRRLRVLASRYGYHYERIRYTHATSRWGSCSSTGTISLNIALMKMPLELIDYVLIHELCHTKEMNHSEAFWKRVAAADPQWRAHRRATKRYSPLL